jgi:crotonobetainyl-CoA:carnitine CoA-transferase CaiB-like acyl-CoA transferase
MPVPILQGLTVIERATFVTGPYTAALLADLGARVIKIESPPAGDSYRYFAPPVHYENLAREKAKPAATAGRA